MTDSAGPLQWHRSELQSGQCIPTISELMATTIKPARRLWYIHGKAYDLTPLLRWHPGGNDVLLACEGRECTEAFENSHSLSSKDIRSLIDRYLVPDAEQGPQPVGFTFEDSGFYAELRRRVKVYFNSRDGNHKATWNYWVKLYLLMAVYITAMYFSLVKGSLLVAPIAGSLWMLFLFYGSLHDASHQALSQRPWVNKLWSVLTSHWGLWHHELWFVHSSLSRSE
jgi:cytochrome b involved in lipid metabolism